MLLLLSEFLCVKFLDMVEVGAVDEVGVIGLCEVVAIFEIGAWLSLVCVKLWSICL